MALMLYFFYFIIFCSIHCVQSKHKKLCEQGDCPNGNKFQSPINIIPCDCRRNTCGQTTNNKFQPLKLENFNSLADVTVTNTGHTLKSSQKQSAYIVGGPLNNEYNFAQLHLHWGRTDNEGSEHRIDNKKFSMEAHFVFSRSYVPQSRKRNVRTPKIKSTKPCDVEAETERRTESNANVVDKFRKRNTYSKNTVTISVVLGVLFDKSENAIKYDLLEKADKLVNVNSTITEKGQFISQLVSSMNLDNYFTYSGSLTTPPYSTNVIWIVLRDPLSVSSDQLDLLRKLKSDEGLITENFREIQPLTDRVLVCSRQSRNNSATC
uniref:Carbonic anhydrase n=1 Tax=Triatoma matogrossensis TaxID=162370 RepID=E2J7F9_9HEMI